MSKNEVERLKSLRGKLAVLCPETDGLQAKHRIKRMLKGKTRQEQVEEILNTIENEIYPLINIDVDNITKRIARLASLIYQFEGLDSQDIYNLIKNEVFKNYY